MPPRRRTTQEAETPNGSEEVNDQEDDRGQGDPQDRQPVRQEEQRQGDQQESVLIRLLASQPDWQSPARPKPTPPKGHVIKAGEEITFPADPVNDELVVITQDVYREFYPGQAKSPSYALVHAAGTVLPRRQLERKG